MTIAQVRAAMSTAIDAISGVRSVAYITDIVNVPTAGAYATTALGEVTYDSAWGGPHTYELIVTVYADRGEEKRSQVLLDALKEPLGSGSLKAALEGNTSLLALASSFAVKSASAVGVETVGEGGPSYLTVEWTCEAMF